MERFLRKILIIIGLLSLMLATGFCLRLPWTTIFWPWADSRMPYTFLGSITAAAALSLLWIGFAGELGAIVGGSIHLMVFYAGLTISLLVFSLQRHDGGFLTGSLLCMGGMLISAGVFLWFRRYPFQYYQPTPLLVRISFCLFIALLLTVGVAALLQIPNVFAWELSPTSSVLIGSFFVGAACYFIYGLIHPQWNNACGQLWAFLAYDLVLIGPFLMRFATVNPERMPSLIINTSVLVYSAGLAIYYLLINKGTRTWGMASGHAEGYHDSPSLHGNS